MAEITKSIEVDVAKLNTFKAIIAKQGDNLSRYLKVQLLNETEPFNVDKEASASINVERIDGQAKAFAGTVNSEAMQQVKAGADKEVLQAKITYDRYLSDNLEKKEG